MRLVYKVAFPKITLAGERGIVYPLPLGHRVVHVALQNGLVAIWYETNPYAAAGSFLIQLFGTGHEITDSGLSHVGAILDGDYVWHIYMRPSGISWADAVEAANAANAADGGRG